MTSSKPTSRLRRLGIYIARWFDAQAGGSDYTGGDRIQWLRVVPFLALHLACLGVIWAGWSWTAVGVSTGLFFGRMFGITGGYHRYFSHRTYRMSRGWQLAMAVLGNSAAQRGPLWWAAHHRHHHRHADGPEDTHSPVQRGFWWSHIGWLMTGRNFRTRRENVQDWWRFPELRFLDRFSLLVPLVLLGALLAVGGALGRWVPAAGTSALQMGVWGFAISTVALFHATSTINSLDHLVGTRRYATPDNSRNNVLLAVLTMGEGWHNNHHHYPSTVRQGFRWWQWDPTWYLLVVLSWLGIVRQLKPLPAGARAGASGMGAGAEAGGGA